MKRKWIIALIVLISFFAPGCGYKLVRHDQLNEPYYEAVKKRVSAERGLEWIEDVEVRIIDRTQVRAMLETEMDKEFPPERVKELERAYIRMGLLDPGTDLREVLLGFITGAGAGFYDPEEKVLYLVKEVAGNITLTGLITRRDMTSELVVAHELAHALDDQHFDLNTLSDEHEDNDDAMLAITALEEGSATIVGFSVIYRPRMEMEGVFAAVRRFNNLNRILLGILSPSTPSVVRDMMLFGYGAGSNFIEALYMADGGWEAINIAYEDPPVSSEAILHPHKYMLGDDPPRIPELDIAAGDFGDGWLELDRNTMGEFGIQVLMGRFIKKEDAVVASEGWGGDKYIVVESPDGKVLAWIWVTVWDSEEEALQFDRAYRLLLQKKYDRIASLATKAEMNPGIGLWDTGGEGLVWTSHRGDRVVIVEGANQLIFDAIHENLGIDAGR